MIRGMKWTPGTVVEVRPAGEILQTLDEQGMLDGLPFMPEMLRFCGQRFRLSRRLGKTCSEAAPRGGRMRHFPSEDVVHLEGLRCDGAAHDGCQRACMTFWKEAWLRTPEPAPSVDRPSPVSPGPQPQLPTRSSEGGYVCQSTALLSATRPSPRLRQLRVFGQEILQGALGFGEALSYAVIPLLMIAKNALGFDVATRGSNEKTPDEALDLKPGEWVRVRSKAEIAATLDRWGRNRGLEFTPVMHECCNRMFRVNQRVDRMILETSGRMREIRNTVILEGATCRGSVVIGGCPRNQYHLWREIWLRRVEPRGSPAGSRGAPRP